MISDQHERDLIEHELDTNFLVEAGAGSGKTRSMVLRMISLIKMRKAAINQIAAITFTNKAASELRSRFVSFLEKAVRVTQTEEEAVLLKEAYENVNQSFIGTIHSFCGSLLRERPFEAGLDPAFTEMDEDQAKEFQDQCWDEVLTNLTMTGETKALEELSSYGIDSETLRNVYHRMIENIDVAIFTQEVDYPNFDGIRTAFLSLIEELKAFIPTTRPDKDWDRCQKAVRDSLQLMKIKDVNDDLTLLEMLEKFDFDAKGNVTLNKWTDKTIAKEFRDDTLPEFQERILSPFLRSWREFIHPKIVRFIQPIIEYCQERKKERGLVDFQDLLLKTTQLLRGHEDVRNYFKKRYTHLLVDEFQDTDPVQAEMMLLLTGKDTKEMDWKKQVPEEGSLFIVGDPKQSIYRFRRADMSTYHFVKKKIEENGEVLKLTSNFRSVEAIGDYVDACFESKFSSEESGTSVQAPFAPMNTTQPNPDDLHGVYTITIPKVNRNNPREICEEDSSRIASFIAWACQGNLKIQDKDAAGQPVQRKAQPGDFLILLSQKKYLHVYAEKLEQYGILSDITGSTTKYDEVMALVQLVKCLNDRQDPVPLLAVLRGMLFGCSDEELYQYKRQCNYISLSNLPGEEDITDEIRPVYEAILKLKQYGTWVSRVPALAAFVKIIEDLGLLPYSVIQSSGLIHAGTLVQLIDTVQADPFAAANWNDLTHLLSNLLDEKKGIEGTGLFLGSSQAVRIMNLHKAKGLEAPVVFLAGPFGKTEHPPTEHIDRSGEDPVGYFAISKDKKIMAEPVGWEEKSQIELNYIEAEADRLLYVAATRPKQMLVISRYPDSTKISPWEDLSLRIPLDRELQWIGEESKERTILEEAPKMTKALKNWNDWLQFAKQASLEKTNVTTMVKTEASTVLPRSNEGKGPVFGTVVHRSMEEIGKGRDQGDLPALVGLIAEEEGLEKKHLGAAIQAVQGILNSAIWQRGQKARERYHEFSFFIQKENDQIQGVIDFLFEEEDGWVIVDFKTDTFEEQNQAAFADHYSGQVNLYSQEWQDTFNYKVKEKGLYFTHNQHYIVV